MKYLIKRKPLFSIVPEFFLIPSYGPIGEELPLLCRSSFMRSIQLFELDDNYILNETPRHPLCYDQLVQLTHLRISLWCIDQCLDLLNCLGTQLQSFTVVIATVFENASDLITDKIKTVTDILSIVNSIN